MPIVDGGLSYSIRGEECIDYANKCGRSKPVDDHAAHVADV